MSARTVRTSTAAALLAAALILTGCSGGSTASSASSPAISTAPAAASCAALAQAGSAEFAYYAANPSARPTPNDTSATPSVPLHDAAQHQADISPAKCHPLVVQYESVVYAEMYDGSGYADVSLPTELAKWRAMSSAAAAS